MTAAIYARKSNEQAGIADEQKSVARQVEHARAWAVKQGWSADNDHVYVDDAVSGAEFTRRPGLVRLMGALTPRAPFDVLVVSELSRLGRESIETAYLMKQLSQAGVKVYSYLDGKEIALTSPTDKFLMSAVAFASEVEREKAAQRVTDAMRRRALAGHATGGGLFGYVNREVRMPDGRRSHVEREIHEQEAKVVKRIFRECAAGKGLKAIAKLLNEDGALAPKPKRNRPRAWAPSSVRSVLHNELYRGVAVWNKRKQSDAWGQRATTMRPESDWIRAKVPHLRIVTDAEWNAAHKRLQNAQAVYLRSTDGRVWGRPPSDIASKYLLSGLGRCAVCGASMTVRGSSHGRQHYYVCAAYDHKGTSVCANGLRLPMRMADDAVLSTLVDYVLDPTIVEGAITDAVAALRPSHDALAAQRDHLTDELRRLDDQQQRYVAALATAGAVDALAEAMKTCERDRRRVQRDLAALGSMERVTTFDARRVERDLRSRLAEWRGLMGRQRPIARQVVSRLLDGRIEWTPHRDESRYEFRGRARFDGILAGIVDTRGMVPVRGFEPRSRG